MPYGVSWTAPANPNDYSERNISYNPHLASGEHWKQNPTTDAGRSLLAAMIKRRDNGGGTFASAAAAYRPSFKTDDEQAGFERAYGRDWLDVRPVSFMPADLDAVAARCAADPNFVEFR